MVCQLISFPNTNLHHFLSVGTSYERRSQKVVQLSQSFQSAPFNDQYTFSNSSPAIVVANPKKSQVNSYKGAAFQQATSVVTDGNRAATQLGSLDGSVAGGNSLRLEQSSRQVQMERPLGSVMENRAGLLLRMLSLPTLSLKLDPE